MTVLRVTHHDAVITVSFRLSRFISDWPTAQQKFISGIADGFHDLHPVRPQDFSVIPAFSLEDLQCKCQLFGGACRIVLAPETLRLSFSNVKRGVQSVVFETIQRSSDWLFSALGDHGRDWLSFNTCAHMQALDDGAVDAYLSQFMPAVANELMKSEHGVKFLPSNRTVFSEEEDGWVLRRVVEKSELIENGVFVDTQVQLQSPELALANFRTQAEILVRLDRLADRSVGLQCEDT